MDNRFAQRSLIVCVALGLGAPAARAENASGVEVPAQPRFTKADASTYGTELATYLDRFDSGWVDFYDKATMILQDASGARVTREITQQILEGRTGDRSLVRFLGPADIRGVAALIHEHPRTTDDAWLYLPASRRVRRISGANRTASFQGTEFTYEDLSGIDVVKYRWRFVEDASVKVDGSEQPVYVLSATPTYRDTGYSRLAVYINQRHWRVEKIEFFDKARRKLKTLTYSGWQQYHDRFWRPGRLDMKNHQTRKRTLIEMGAQFVNLSLYPKRDGTRRSGLREGQFTRSALEAR